MVLTLATVRPLGFEPVLRRVASAVAALAARVSVAKRHMTEAALAATFGSSLPAAARRRLARATFDAFWSDTFALARRPGAAARLRRIQVDGLQHLEAALARGRGAILWESSGFGSRNLAKQVLAARGYPLVQVHAEAHLAGFGDYRQATWLCGRVAKPYFDRLTRGFADEIVELSPDGSLAFTRALARRLGDNRLVCIAGDGSLGHGWAPVPFLGGSRRFATGTAHLAALTGAPLLPLVGVLDPGPRVVIHEPIPVDPHAGRDRLALGTVTRYASLLEAWVRRLPGQYRGWPTLHDQRATWSAGPC